VFKFTVFGGKKQKNASKPGLPRNAVSGKNIRLYFRHLKIQHFFLRGTPGLPSFLCPDPLYYHG
jgi:hypothetical protein